MLFFKKNVELHYWSAGQKLQGFDKMVQIDLWGNMPQTVLCCPQLGSAALKQVLALHHVVKIQQVTEAHGSSAKAGFKSTICCCGEEEMEKMHWRRHCWRNSPRCMLGRRSSVSEEVTSEGQTLTGNSCQGSPWEAVAHGNPFWSRATSGRTEDLKLTITQSPQTLLLLNTSPKELG